MFENWVDLRIRANYARRAGTEAEAVKLEAEAKSLWDSWEKDLTKRAGIEEG